MTQLPTIDLRPFLDDPTSTHARDVAHRLCDASHAPGFCYIRSHGVPENLDTALLDAAQRFFELPESERLALAISNSPHFRGYTRPGGEFTKGARDWREQLDVGPEDPARQFAAGDPPWLNLRGPNQWPPSLPALKEATTAWMAAMEPVGVAVMRAMAIGLGQPVHLFDDAMLPSGDVHTKIIRYPAQIPDSDTGQGVGMHHDSGVLTFILQDDTGGLEVQTEQGIVAATSRPGCYVMNLGEMLQAATNGYLRATPHRVISPPSGKARLSIAFFAHPRLEARFEPIALPHELAAQCKGAQNPDPNDPVFSTFGENCLKIRLRAHPDVAEKFYREST